MPIIKAQKKSVRQSERRRIFNDRRRRAMRESIKNLKALVAEGQKKEAEAMIPTVYQAIDKAVKRGVIKPNTASRKKSQASRIVKEIA